MKLPENRWRSALDAVFAEFASSEGARLGAQKPDVAIDEACLLGETLNKLERTSIVQTSILTFEYVMGRAFSMAGTLPDDLRDKLPAFERALQNALEPFLLDGKLMEITEPQALVAHR